MKKFLDDNFLLDSPAAVELYRRHAEPQPIIDYHNHLPPQDIAADRRFGDLTEAWLEGDHYKWRAMRANGIAEQYITGGASSEEKFLKWAETVPHTLRNPLYHWTHLELRRYFGIHEILSPKTAKAIFEAASEQLHQPECSTRNLLRRMNVRTLCTTDDPADSLEHHQKIREDGFEIAVLPTFRPDKAMAVDDPSAFNAYLDRLAAAADVDIRHFSDLKTALQRRHDFFWEMGCRLSDHGLSEFYAEPFTEAGMEQLFGQLRQQKTLTEAEARVFKSGMLVLFAEMDFEKGWVQQFHVGALRNVNPTKLRSLGPDTGFDTIGDWRHGEAMARFFASLEERGTLTKTIVYNLNPADNYLFASMVGNFQDGTVPGKLQYGAGWWFLDQKAGIEWQLNALSNLGLLSRFVGMLTDSRSFLSYPRHEYFRRILCNLLGHEMETGLLPDDLELVGGLVERVCYGNAKAYFGF